MAELTPWLDQKFYLADGITPNAGGLVFFYEAGTSTKKTTFTDEGEGTPNPNPIVLNSAGEPPAQFWWGAGAYKVVNAPASDTDPPTSPIKTWDDVLASGSDPDTPTSVDTIEELRALEGGITNYVTVGGYYAAADGGGGTFFWNALSTDTDNGGTIILPDSSPAAGRWIRVFEGNVSPLWFGAEGDYIVGGAINGSARDNTTIFNTLFAYCRTNELAVKGVKGAYKVTDFLVCSVPIIGDLKGKVETTAEYGSTTWNTSTSDFDGFSIIWDKSTLAVGDVYLRNVSGDETSDVEFRNVTFYSLSDAGGTEGGGQLLVNDSAQSGTEYDFGDGPTFVDCNIVNFGTALTVNLFNGWNIGSNTNFVGCQQPLLAGNDGPEEATDISFNGCKFLTCGDTSTAFIQLDNVQGFKFNRCNFSVTSEISIRIAVDKGLSFNTCTFNVASLNSLGDFITVVSTAGFNCDEVSFRGCDSGGSMGNINLIQQTNVAELTIIDSDLTGATVPLGTDNVTLIRLGKATIDGTTGTSKTNLFTDADFNFEGVLIEETGPVSKLISTDDNGNRLFISAGVGTASTNGAVLALSGDEDDGAVILSAGTGTGTQGDITLITSAGQQVLVNNTDDSTSTITGALAIAGGLGVGGNVFSGGDLVVDTAGGGLNIAEGSDARMGTDTLSGNTVTISTTEVTANSRIFLTYADTALAPSIPLYIFSRIAGTSFIVRGSSSDDFVWMIVEPS